MLNRHKKYTYIGLILIILCAFVNLSEAYVSDLELRGTVFTRSLKPIAIIKDKKTGAVNMYETGESIGKTNIIEIKRGEIVLKEGMNSYVLALPGGSVEQPQGLDFEISKEGGIFYVSRAEVNKAILKAPLLMRDIKIMPNFAQGKPEGIRLGAVKEGSIFQKAGVKSGDVVKNVNGMALNTPYQIFQAYKKLKGERNFKVDVLRDNKPVALTYIIE